MPPVTASWRAWAGLVLLFTGATALAAHKARNEVVLDEELRFTAHERAPEDAVGRPGASRHEIPLGQSPAWGSPAAPVTLVEIGDLAAGVTYETHALVLGLEAVYGPERLRVVWKHRPLPVHLQAEAAAEIACAVYDLAGPIAFRDFVERVLDNAGRLSESDMLVWAHAAGVADTKPMAEGLRVGAWSERIASDMRDVAAVGAGGARLVIDGLEVSPLATEDDVRDLLDRELGGSAPARGAPGALHAVFSRPFDVPAGGRALRVDSTVVLPPDRSLGARVSLVDLTTGDATSGSLDVSSFRPRAWGEYWGGNRQRTTAWFGRVSAGPHALRVEPSTEPERIVPDIHMVVTSDAVPFAMVMHGALALLALLLADAALRTRDHRRRDELRAEAPCDT